MGMDRDSTELALFLAHLDVLGSTGLAGLMPGMPEAAVRELVPEGKELHWVRDNSGELVRSLDPDGREVDQYDVWPRIQTRVLCRAGVLQLVNFGIASDENAVVNGIATKLRARFKKQMGVPEKFDGAGIGKGCRYSDESATVDVVRSSRAGSHAAGIATMQRLRVTWRLAESGTPAAVPSIMSEITSEPGPSVAGILIGASEAEITERSIVIGGKQRLRILQGGEWVPTKPGASLEGRLLDIDVLSVRAEIRKAKCRRIEVQVSTSDLCSGDQLASRFGDHYTPHLGSGVVVRRERQLFARSWPDPPLDMLTWTFERG